MQEKHMRTFVEVARLGSFSKAAEALFLSVPALKKQMDALEDDLQVTLFVRTNNGIRLTKAGEAYLSFTQKTLASMTAERFKLKQIAATDNNVIRFGYNATDFNDPVYIYAFSAFKKAYPYVSIDFVRGALNDPSAYDLFIGTTQIVPYKTHLLRTFPAFCILSRDCPLTAKSVLQVSDLRRCNIRTLSKSIISEMVPTLFDAFSQLEDTDVIYIQDFVSQRLFYTYALEENVVSIIFGNVADLPDMLVAIPLEGYTLSYELHIPHPIEKPIVAEYVDFITEYYRTHAP